MIKKMLYNLNIFSVEMSQFFLYSGLNRFHLRLIYVFRVWERAVLFEV